MSCTWYWALWPVKAKAWFCEDFYVKHAKPILVRIYKILLEIKNGMSSTKSVEGAVIKTAGWDVRDVKFVDDYELMLAMSTKCKPAGGIMFARRFSSHSSKLLLGFSESHIENQPMPTVNSRMPVSKKETSWMAMMTIPVLTFLTQTSPANTSGENSLRESRGLQKQWRSMVGRVDVLFVCLLRIGSITECMI